MCASRQRQEVKNKDEGPLLQEGEGKDKDESKVQPAKVKKESVDLNNLIEMLGMLWTDESMRPPRSVTAAADVAINWCGKEVERRSLADNGSDSISSDE